MKYLLKKKNKSTLLNKKRLMGKIKNSFLMLMRCLLRRQSHMLYMW